MLQFRDVTQPTKAPQQPSLPIERFTITTLAGLEEILAQELTGLGITVSSTRRQAVGATGNRLDLYRSLYHLRTALRVLVHIDTFDARNPDELYRLAGRTDWSRLLDGSQTFAVDCTASSSFFRNSGFAALRLKDAIADQFRSRTGRRPSVQTDFPDLRIHLHIEESRCTLSRDAAGDSLHRRGYRTRTGEAPLNEVLAAGMILLSGWRPDAPLVDPFCGSGTIVIEAAMIAAGIAPGALRRRYGAGSGSRRRQSDGREPTGGGRTAYGCMAWKDFNPSLWSKAGEGERSERGACDASIVGLDASAEVLGAAKENAKRARVDDLICLEGADARRVNRSDVCGGAAAGADRGTIVTNPPYGERIPAASVGDLYREMGDNFKRHFGGFDAWVLSGNLAALKQVGLRSERRITLYNGPLECRFVHYRLNPAGRSVGEGRD